MNEDEVLLNIVVNYGDALNGINQYQRAIIDLRNTNKELAKEFDEGKIDVDQYGKAVSANSIIIKEYGSNIRQLEKEIRNNLKVEKEQNDSLVSLRAQLSNTTRAFDELSKAEREGAKGQEYINKIKSLQNELLQAENATGRFQRSVGSYEQAILKAASGNNSFAQSLITSAGGVTNLGSVIDVATAKAKAFFAALIVNPVIAVIAAIVAIFTVLKNAIDSNEEASQRLAVATEGLRRVMNFLFSIIQQVADIALYAVEAFDSMYRGFLRLAEYIPFVGKRFGELNSQIAASIELQREFNRLQQAQRTQAVEDAKAQEQISELRAKASDRELYTAQERLEFTRQAAKIAEENSQRELKLAEQQLSLEQQRADQTKSSTDDLNRLAQLEADVYRKRTAYNNQVRQNNREQLRIQKEIEQQNTKSAKAADDGIKKASAAQKKALADEKEATRVREANLQAARLLEDQLTGLIRDEAVKRETVLRQSYARQIEDLKIRLETEKRLTEESRAAINETIVVLQKRLDIELEELAISEANRTQQRILRDINNRLSAIRVENEESLKLRISAIDIQRDLELSNAEKTGADRAAINLKYDRQIEDARYNLEKETNDRLIKERQAYYTNRINEARVNGELENNVLKIQLEQAKFEYDNLIQGISETDAEYLNRRQEIAIKIAELDKQQAEAVRLLYETNVAALAEFFGAASDLLNEFADQSSTLAAFSKALALFEITLNSGKAISAGVAAAQSVPFPGNIAAIATTVAAILKNIASATKIAKSANTPSYADGGLVTGSGTSTSDSIVANLSNGESVMRTRTTQLFTPMLSTLNQIGGGVSIPVTNPAAVSEGNEILGAIVARELSKIRPVVSVDEISRVANRVQVLENNRKI